MSARTPSSDTASAAREQRRQAMIDLHLQRLDQVIEAGMGMIAALAAQVAGTGPQVVEGDAALAYSRFSRAVRQGILLQTQLLAEPEEAKPAKPEAEAEPKDVFYSWLENDHSKRAARIDHVEQIVERMMRSDGEPEETVERLSREAAERAEKFEVYGDLAYRPMSEVLAEICRDLGLNPDWAVLKTHAWARKEIAEGEEKGEEVGWPLKDGPPPPAGWIGPWPPKRHDPGHVTAAFPSKRGPKLPDAEDWAAQAEFDST